MADLPLTRWTIGAVAPLLLLLFAAADVLTRLVPLEAFAFRTWEGLVANGSATGPFGASRRVRVRDAYGDLAGLSGVRSLREPHDEQASTDAWGFRNPPEFSDGAAPVAALMVGDSFGAGAGSNDDQTVPAQLGRLLGQRVYNLSGLPIATLSDVRWAARRLKLEEGIVIYEYLTRGPPPAQMTLEAPGFLKAPGQASPVLGLSQRLAPRVVDLRTSRVGVVASRARAQLTAWLAGPAVHDSGSEVATLQLSNGRPMLFLQTEVNLARAPRTLSPDSFIWLAHQLEADHLKLLVLIVPDKYEVYAPLLKEPPALPLTSAPGVEGLAAALDAARVPVVDLTAPLQAAAARAFQHGELIYWSDDTHWNATAMQLAAEALAPQVQALRASPARP